MCTLIYANIYEDLLQGTLLHREVDTLMFEQFWSKVYDQTNTLAAAHICHATPALLQQYKAFEHVLTL